MISRQDGRFVLDVLGDGRVFVYRLRSGDILAGDIQVGGNVVHVVDRVIVPQSMEGRLLFRQAHRESEVEQSAAGAESRFNARLLLAELVRQADTLGDEAVIPLYEFGLRIADARAADDRLELPTSSAAAPAGRNEGREPARIPRHDRQRVGVGGRLVRRLHAFPEDRPGGS